MPKVQFYLMDITYKIIDGKAIIYLFGRGTDGKQICLIDKNFKPYFYALVEGNVFLEKEIMSINVPMTGGAAFATNVETEKKKVNGRDATLVKITANIPKGVPLLKDEVRKLSSVEEVFEYDILFVRRYLFDKRITPLCLIEAEGDLSTERSRVPVIEISSIKQISDEVIPKPKILSIDIETYCKHQGVINPKKDPILMIALYGPGISKVITYKEFKHKHDFLEVVSSEEELLSRFKDIVLKYKPDIITGYYSDGFDFPYIVERAIKYKIELDIGLDYSKLKIDGKVEKKASITGMIHLDALRFIQRVVGRSLKTDSYSLENVSQELLGEGKHDIDIGQLANTWDEGSDKLADYAYYNLVDARLTHEIMEKIMPNLVELSKIICLPPTDVSRMSFSALVEWFIIKKAIEAGEIIPNKPSYKESARRGYDRAKGAFVFEPTPGVYFDIAVFDFKSLYPSILISHNISIDTFKCKCCSTEKVPLKGEDYWFCKKKKGFLASILGEIVERRTEIKELMRSAGKDALLVARSEALKVLANSFYGYLGFAPARWYSHEAGASITAYGRHYIKKVISKAEENGFGVLYSDTDSVFLHLKGKKEEDALDFAAVVNRGLPGVMELEFEGFYAAGIFVSVREQETGAKKKYALMDNEGKITIKGFETVRRNFSFIAKDVQKEVLEMVLKDGNAKRALEFVKETIEGLRKNQIPTEKVVIRTQISKPLDSYTAIGPHVAAARQLAKKGIPVGAGTVIRYVVCKGSGKIRDRVKLDEDAKQNEYDGEYYINNQILPSVERIFSVFEIDADTLVSSTSQKGLNSFF